MTLNDGAGVTGLIAAPDENLYGIAVAGGGMGPFIYGGTFFQITTSGQLTVLDDFPVDFDPPLYYSPADLILAPDGSFFIGIHL